MVDRRKAERIILTGWVTASSTSIGYIFGMKQPSEFVLTIAMTVIGLFTSILAFGLLLVVAGIIWTKTFRMITNLLWRGYDWNGQWPPVWKMKLSAMTNYIGEFKFLTYWGRNDEKIAELMENAEREGGVDHSDRSR